MSLLHESGSTGQHGSRNNQIPGARILFPKPAVHADLQHFFAFFQRSSDVPKFFFSPRQRLFAEDVLAGLKSCANLLRVEEYLARKGVKALAGPVIDEG